MKTLISIMMALMLLVGGGVADETLPEAPWQLIQEDGKTFIELTGNPSTGYIWTVFAIVDGVVTVTDPAPVAAEKESHLVGEKETYRIEVTAENAGETILVLRYLRPWEMDIQQEIPVLVTVDEAKEMFFMQLDGMPMEVTVSEVMTEEHMILVESETLGQLICTFPEEMPLPMAGENIKIWSNGVMALSFPGRINVLGWETVAPPQARMMPAPADGE